MVWWRRHAHAVSTSQQFISLDWGRFWASFPLSYYFFLLRLISQLSSSPSLGCIAVAKASTFTYLTAAQRGRWLIDYKVDESATAGFNSTIFLHCPLLHFLTQRTQKREERKEVINSSYGNADQWLGRGVVFAAEMSSKCCELIVKDYRTLHKSLLSTRFDGEREALNFQLWRSKARQQPLWLSKVATQSFVV